MKARLDANMSAPWRRRGHLIALAVIVWVLLHAGLSPFDLTRSNGVEWRADRSGLLFDGTGIAFSEAPIELEPGAGELTLEVWIRPGEPSRWREGTIVSLMDDDPAAPFALSTRDGALTLRYRLRQDDGVSTRAISLGDAFENDEIRHIAVTSGAGGTRVYLDGVAPDRLRSKQSLVDPERGLRSRVVLGNLPQGYSGWIGELHGVAFYDRVLSEAEIATHTQQSLRQGLRSLGSEPGLRALYVFDSPTGRFVPNLVSSPPALHVPDMFTALRWDVLKATIEVSPLRSARLRRDMALNLLGFIPLGMVLMSLLRADRGSNGLRFMLVCALGALLSLAIELGQALLPMRYSSLLDLALNLLGTALGAAFVVAWSVRSRRVESDLGTVPSSRSAPET